MLHRRSQIKLRPVLSVAFIMALGTAAHPAIAQTCEATSVQEELQYLRRLSIDLRGKLPSETELETVATEGHVNPGAIDRMLASEAFVDVMRAHHRDILSTNLANVDLANLAWRIRGPGRDSAGYYNPSNGRTRLYRGGPVGCLDEPARFDPTTGAILTQPDATNPAIQREGWVELEPYWAMGTRIKVCAFDAQANLEGRSANGQPVDCARGTNSRQCGCGPNLRWCESSPDGTRLEIQSAMSEQLLRFVARVVRENRPYTELLTAKDMEINGPLSHWLRFQIGASANELVIVPDSSFTVPEVPFEQSDDWRPVSRGALHAGLLTMPGYLGKFQTNRGRANRFYNAFLGQSFQASSPLPPATDPCHAEQDLTKRCGCKDCHVAVEPAAAYWGRFGEASLAALDEARFPKSTDCCKQGGTCSAADRRFFTPQICSRFYFTERDLTGPDDPSSRWLGSLRAFVFADATREANIATGPLGIANQAIQSGAFAEATVRRIWKLLLARPPLAEEKPTIDELTRGFAGHWSLQALVKDVVTRPEYVKAGRFSSAD